MTAYYNENDKYAAQWLRNLIAAGHIAPGDVDDRSIADVRASELAGYKQCHFFAGIGIWSHALRRAGWPDDAEVWSGSCPCQPFSAAGQGGGFDDARHLWPAFYQLIAERKPAVVFGEQVASKNGLAWLDLVQTDLEASDYAVGALDMCSAGFGAPHIRQRLYWAGALDYAADARRHDPRQHVSGPSLQSARSVEPSAAGLVADAGHEGFQVRPVSNVGSGTIRHEGATAATNVVFSELADADEGKRGRLTSGQKRVTYGETSGRQQSNREPERDSQVGRPGPVNGQWRDADWLHCRDGKWRPVESGTFPLAHGDPARVGRLRAYGNAINAEQATEFVAAFMACRAGGLTA